MPTNTSPARHPHQHHHHSNGSHTRASSRDAPVISATAAAAAADFDASVVPLGPKATTQRRYHRDFMRSSQHYASGAPSQPRASSYVHHSNTQQRSRRNPEAPTDAPADAPAAGNGSFATGRKKKRSAHKKRDTADKIVSKNTNGKDQQGSPTKSHNKLGSIVSTDTSGVSAEPKLKLGFGLEQIRVSLPKVGSSLDDEKDDFGIKHRKQPSTMEGSVDSRSPSPSRSPVIRGISVTPPLMDEDEVAAGKNASAPCPELKVSSIGTVIVDSSIVNKNRRRFPFEDPEYYAHQLSLYFYDLNNNSASHESHGGAAAAAPQPSLMGATVPLVHPALPVPNAAPGLISAPPMSYYPAYDPYGVPAYPYSSRPNN